MWKHIAAKATGASHLKQGQPCQDRFACEEVEGGWFVAAVSDGAGSAPYADVGAEVAARTAAAACKAELGLSFDPLEAVLKAFDAARCAVVQHAEEAGAMPRDFATTLLLLLIGPQGGAAAQIGDGLIAVKADADGWSWVFWPQRGEYANVTQFLTDPTALANLQATRLDGAVREFGLTTDGLEPLALHYASQSVHDPFFEGMMPALRAAETNADLERLSESLAAFLASPRVSARTDDDLTLILAARR